jgi:hypothetical protein
VAARRRTFAVLAVIVALLSSAVVMTTSALAESAPADPGGGQVWSEIRNPDGTTSVSVYTASPGVSTAVLHASLKSAGIKGLLDPAAKPTQDATAAATSCAYGRANTLTCSPVRWSKRGFDDPQVYFRDSTASGWPVSASVTEWNRAVGADSYYIWHTSSGCPSASTGRHCVAVQNESGATRDWIGRIVWQADANRFFVDGSVRIYFNTRTSGPSEDWRSAVCKHLGQALGVGRNEVSSSCMYNSSVSGPDPRYPNSDDYGLIRYALYPD